MNSMNIKGKQYIPVNERIKEFRSNEKYDGWSIRTEILQHQEGMIMMKAIARDKDDRIIAEGTAYEINEVQGRNEINLTSYIENCETSAVGRCLGMLGIGIDVSVASADEVTNAVRRQPTQTTRQVQNTEREQPRTTGATPYIDHEWGRFEKGQKLQCNCGGTTYVNQNKTNNELFISNCKSCGAGSIHLGPAS